MQSLDSSCQEADFIINDTLKKLKGSNSGNSNSNSASLATSSSLTHSGSTSILRQSQQQQTQLSYHHAASHNKYQQQYHHLHSALQGTNSSSSATNVAGSGIALNNSNNLPQLSPQSPLQNLPPPSLVSAGYSHSYSNKSSLIDSSLLHCNISQIPSQPPLCIFEGDADDETPTDQPPIELLASVNSSSGGGSLHLDSLSLLTQSTNNSGNNSSSTVIVPLAVPSPVSSCSASSVSLSNFNSITSPSPIVPDLLLSTPPGVNSSSSSSHTSNHSNNNNNNKKAEKRPSATTSNNGNNNGIPHHHQNHLSHATHLLSSANTTSSLTSPTSSPSKRQKTKDSSLTSLSSSTTVTNKLSTHSPSLASRIGSAQTSSISSSSAASSSSKRGGDPSSANSVNSSTISGSTVTSSHRFFNIHERIKEHYLQLLANDLNLFAEIGLKQRTRSFILERVVECEKLNTIVVNLYPGNKGYALALHYDDRQQLTADSDGSLHILGTHYESVNSSSLSSTSSVSTLALHKSISSRNSASSNPSLGSNTKLFHSVVPPDLKTSEFDVKHKRSYDPAFIDNSFESAVSEYPLVEVLRWPYENDQLLQCIDREVLPDFLMDMLVASTVTLQAPQDDSTATARLYVKPNVFYGGCVVAQVRDFRQTFATSTNICDTRHVLLRPTNATLFADVQHIATILSQNSSSSSVVCCAPEDKPILESQLVLATAEPLCLDPDPSIGRHAINSQHERQIFYTHELRRQMKKYTQIAINRKRKLDQFTHHYGLELCDYLARLRARPRNVGVGSSTSNSGNSLVNASMLSSFASKVPKRPRDVIRPIRPPRLDYPANLKVPDQLINVEKFAKINERPRETTDCHPILIEEYILETEREDNEGRRVIYHIKLSIFQRPSNSEYLGELYVDRDYREGERNGESCRFPLGTRVHANRYIQQFTEIFTEEGRKAVKITHLMPGHLPKVTHTGITPEQRQALLLQQQQQQQIQLQQRQAALLAAQQQQQQQQLQKQAIQTPATTQQQHVVVVGPNGQQQHILPATVQHVTSSTTQTIGTGHQSHQVAKNINILGISGNNAASVHQVLRQHQQQQQQHPAQVATHFLDANGATVQLQHATLTATNVNATTNAGPNTASSGVQQVTTQPAAPHIQLQQIANTASGVGGSGGNTTTTHQLSLSNGSLVLVQQHPAQNAANHQTHHQVLQHAGITIQPATTHQQKSQVITTTQMNALPPGTNSALRSQLTSSVPILQAQLKAAPIVTTSTQHQQQLLHKQQNTATVPNTAIGVSTASSNTGTNLHSNPAINAIVTSIMNSANQWQQQQQQQQNSSINTSSPTTTLKNSSNASILSLLNSAPAAMTSTPVASGTFTASTGQTQQQQQQQTVTLVQHTGHTLSQTQSTVITTDSYVQATPPRPQTPTVIAAQQRKQQNEVLQNLLNPARKINIVSGGGGGGGGACSTTTTFRTNTAGNLIAVNLGQSANNVTQHHHSHHGTQQQQQHQQQQEQSQPSQTTVRVSMSALASQLASPPAIMTNSTNFGSYTLSTVGGAGSSNSGSIKILNSGIQQQRVLASALRRDSLNANQAPPNAIVVGVAAPSPGSDSNASNASGFAVPQAASSNSTNNNNTNTTTLNALLANAATPSPSGSDHSQSSQTQNQTLLERLNSGGVVTAGATMPNMSPQQSSGQSQQAQQYITKSLVQSPATSSIHSPMSSPHPQPSPSPHLQQQQQTGQTQTATATLNLQGINFSTLQGAMANFQNVQVQIPGFTQPISLQLTGGSLQPQTGNATVSVVATGAAATNNSNAQNTSSASQTQQRSLLVSVPVSSNTGSVNVQEQHGAQSQHTITLQPQQLHQQHGSGTAGTIVNLPTGAVATATGSTQTVVLTNNAGNAAASSANANVGGGGGTGTGGNAGATGGTTMLTLPIAQIVGAGVQKLNPSTLRASTGTTNTTVGGVVGSSNAVSSTGGSIIVQQQQQQQQTNQQQTQTSNISQQQQQQQQATITVSSTGNAGSQTNQAIQLVGTIQQGGRNIQVVGAKHLAGSRQLITQRQIGGSTLKIAAATPVNAGTNAAITSAVNLAATSIVMSTQKLQLKTIKTTSQAQQHQQPHQRILNQITASQASQTTPQQGQQQQQQQQQTQQQPQTQTVIIGQAQATSQQQQTAVVQHQQTQPQTPSTQSQQHIQIQARAGSNLSPRAITAIAAAAAAKQQQAAAVAAAAVAAANRRRSTTDVNK
uniref:Spt20-like SEP domain-containing protein n=1 Tax=Glossina brevipalpis TaxID=37001 RepID=A0A1A9WRN9_9MUSC